MDLHLKQAHRWLHSSAWTAGVKTHELEAWGIDIHFSKFRRQEFKDEQAASPTVPFLDCR
jgi:hypothetical protein